MDESNFCNRGGKFPLEKPPTMRDESDGLVSKEFAAHKISVGLTTDNQTVPNT